MTALQLGLPIHRGDLGAAFRELLQQFLTDVGVSHLPAAEAHGDFHSIPVGEELLAVAELDEKVVLSDAGGHADLLDLNHALILAGLFLTLALLETVLAVIHYLADRRSGTRRDFDQIQILLNGDLHGVAARHYAQLLAVLTDEAHLPVAYFLVDLIICDCYERHLPRSLKSPNAQKARTL